MEKTKEIFFYLKKKVNETLNWKLFDKTDWTNDRFLILKEYLITSENKSFQ